MRFITYGTPDKPALMMIHGMATTARICYHDIARRLKERYYVILAVLDGHDPESSSDFISPEVCCIRIENYIREHLGGKLYALSGFSLGGSIAVTLLQRGNIQVQKVHLDAAFCVKLGVLSPLYTFLFVYGIQWMQSGRVIPDVIIDLVLGKGNKSVCEMLFTDVSGRTIRNCCRNIYRFELKDDLRNVNADVVYWCGANEPYPKKTALLLRHYIPSMKVVVFRGMGHGQLLHEHKGLYYRELMKFLEK